jgi:membrane protein YdbS with pleckstrin-like domain
VNELTQRGIAAMKSGDRDAARQLLAAAIRQDPADLQAWLWLSGAVDRDEERFDCLRQVLRLDADNQSAARGLAQLLKQNPHLRSKVTGMLTPQPAVPAAAQPASEPAEEDLLDRAVQPLPPHPAYPTETTQPATASSPPPSQAGSSRVIVPIYPRRPRPSYNTHRPVFRARPSLVPLILFFWMMLLSLYSVLILLNQDIEVVFPTVVALGVVCSLFVIIMLFRLFITRYELTSKDITIPLHGKQVALPIPTILSVVTQQSGFQKMIGIGDILLDVGIQGILRPIRIRNIPQVQQRTEQILYLIRDQR